MSCFDSADWHFLGEAFPTNAPQENGATHIGIYIAWIINTGLVGEFHLEESRNSLEQIKGRIITGRQFLIKECDMKLTEEDISEIGLDFTDFYYQGIAEKASLFLYDYAEMFIKEPMSFYDVEDTWANYDKLSPVIDERFRSWKAVRKIYDQQKS
jgi:hypothetical protein